jgi:hypothetical protein
MEANRTSFLFNRGDLLNGSAARIPLKLAISLSVSDEFWGIAKNRELANHWLKLRSNSGSGARAGWLTIGMLRKKEWRKIQRTNDLTGAEFVACL